MRQRQARRVEGFGTSIFSSITALAQQHGAVNLGQGFPDFPAPAFIKEAAVRAIYDDRNQYVASAGLPRLRDALAARWHHLHPRAWQPSPETEITVGAGATELLFDAVLGLVDPGDEVVLFEPAYDSYAPAVQMAGAVPRAVRLRSPAWSFDPDELRRAIGPRTRALILNTPHNPTGKIFDDAELAAIAQLAIAHDLVVISDEVYSEIRFDGVRHVPIATLPGMAARTVTIDSMGKAFSVTGWKVGWAIAAAPLSEALRRVHQFVTFTHSAPFQEALADALADARIDDYFSDLRGAYTRRRETLGHVLTEVGFQARPAAGSYFMLCDLPRALPADFPPVPMADGVAGDVAFCRYLIRQIGVAAIPTSVFYADPSTAPLHVRFCFSKSDDTLRAAADRLQRLRLPSG